jgi:hypothetical protein
MHVDERDSGEGCPILTLYGEQQKKYAEMFCKIWGTQIAPRGACGCVHERRVREWQWEGMPSHACSVQSLVIVIFSESQS